MLSKIVTSMALRQQSVRIAARTLMVAVPQRGFFDRLGLDQHSTELALDGKLAEVSLWQEKAKSQEHALVLKDNDQIEKYVLSIVRAYFRTTKKAKVALDSVLTEHGLDSLDMIELVIQIEDELGYVIDADNLNKFKKPRHFVNFITQMEAYKNEFHRLPHENIHAEFSLRAAFPGLPGDKSKVEHH